MKVSGVMKVLSVKYCTLLEGDEGIGDDEGIGGDVCVGDDE